LLTWLVLPIGIAIFDWLEVEPAAALAPLVAVPLLGAAEAAGGVLVVALGWLVEPVEVWANAGAAAIASPSASALSPVVTRPVIILCLLVYRRRPGERRP
jgi:hypothetical protein